MNWLTIAVAVFLVICTALGFKKGLLKEGLILFGALILLWLMSFLLPYTRQAIKDYTPIEEYVSEKVDAAVQDRVNEMVDEKKQEIFGQFGFNTDKLPETDVDLPAVAVPALSKAQETELIENAHLPRFVKRIFIENNNSEIYNRLGVETFTDYLTAYATELIINIIAYVTTFVLAYLIYRLLLAAAHLVDHLPLARSLNHGLGGVLGLAQGLVLLGIFFVVLVLFCRTQAGRACYECIEESRFLTVLYEYNPLMAIVSAVAG